MSEWRLTHLVTELRAAADYAGDDPVNGSDPLGLWGWNPVSDAEEAVNDALPVVHSVSTDIAGLASLCAVVTSETIVGGVTCGAIAAVSGTVAGVSGIALYAEGRESGIDATVDALSAGAGGIGNLAELGGKLLEGGSDSAKAISFIFQDEADVAPWLDKAAALGNSSRVLAFESRVFSALGFAFGVLGQFTGKCP
jgi:hypothetical protein